MSVKVLKTNLKEWTDDRWFRYNQRPDGPIRTGTDNLQSLHIINPSEDKAV